MEPKLDLRIEKTYLSLHQAFTALIENKKFEEFTVNELCEKAMIRRTTFYKHFADKYEYFAFYMKEIADTFQKELNLKDSYTTKEYLISMSGQFMEFIVKNKNLVENIIKSNMFPLLINSLIELIRDDVYLALRKDFPNEDINYLKGKASFIAGGMVNSLYTNYPQFHVNEEFYVRIIAEFL